MAMSNDLNALKALEYQIKEHMMEAIYEKLLSDQVEQFKKDISPLIREAVKDITIGGVESFHDFRFMRDEIHVYLKFNEEDSKLAKVVKT